jgi:hypothetical protein
VARKLFRLANGPASAAGSDVKPTVAAILDALTELLPTESTDAPLTYQAMRNRIAQLISDLEAKWEQFNRRPGSVKGIQRKPVAYRPESNERWRIMMSFAPRNAETLVSLAKRFTPEPSDGALLNTIAELLPTRPADQPLTYNRLDSAVAALVSPPGQEVLPLTGT